MKYSEFQSRNSFAFEELLAFSYGRLVDDPRRASPRACPRRLF